MRILTQVVDLDTGKIIYKEIVKEIPDENKWRRAHNLYPVALSVTRNFTTNEQQRVEMIEKHIKHNVPIQTIVKELGISRKTFYKWLRRYKDGNALSDRSRRPHNFPRATPAETVALLVKEKQETGFGQRKLRKVMLQKYNVNLSERTIWKLLKKHKYNELSGELTEPGIVPVC